MAAWAEVRLRRAAGAVVVAAQRLPALLVQEVPPPVLRAAVRRQRPAPGAAVAAVRALVEPARLVQALDRLPLRDAVVEVAVRPLVALGRRLPAEVQRPWPVVAVEEAARLR